MTTKTTGNTNRPPNNALRVERWADMPGNKTPSRHGVANPCPSPHKSFPILAMHWGTLI